MTVRLNCYFILRFGGHPAIGQLPGPRGPVLPFRAPRPTTPGVNPSPTVATQSPQIQNILNQASLMMQVQNPAINSQQSLHSSYLSAGTQSSGYAANYHDPLNPNYQSYPPFIPGLNSTESYQDSSDLSSIPEAPGTTQGL